MLNAYLKKHPMPIDNLPENWRMWLEGLDKWLGVAGEDIEAVLVARAGGRDLVVQAMCREVLGEWGGAVFAIGGYGRNEVSPYSDTDLLVVFQKEDDWQSKLGELTPKLWDIGLQPAIYGYVMDDAGNLYDSTPLLDVTHATALLDARLIVGRRDLAGLPHRWLCQHWEYERFYVAKLQEKIDRQKSHRYTIHHLEPNLKTGVGGLRAIQLIGWLVRALVVFEGGKEEIEAGRCVLPQLLAVAQLSDDEKNELFIALKFFWQVRQALHGLVGKSEERLLFSHQRAIASQFGFGEQADNPNFAPEQLMRQYFRYAMSVHGIAEMVYELLSPASLHKPSQPFQAIADTPFFVNASCQLVVSPTAFDNPTNLLTLFLVMAEHDIYHIEPNSIRILRQAAQVIDDEYASHPTHQALFIKILSNTSQLANLLNLMAKHGILGRYLPDFGQIMGLMQYDLFHRYTVDDHTLRLVAILGQLAEPPHIIPDNLLDTHLPTSRHFGVLCERYRQLDKPEILHMAALFHDIAKGQVGDHAMNGAKIAHAFCQTHAIDVNDGKLIAWLVQEHLTMSHIAQKQDIYDPAVLLAFADLVGDTRRLNYLYLLTVADMNATNHQLWNDWRATLLNQLYQATHSLLLAGGQHQFDQLAILNERKRQAEQLAKRELTAIWQAFGADYVAKNNANSLSWHANCVLENGKLSNRTMIVARPHPDTGLNAYELMIYAPNQVGLFLTTVQALNEFHYNVLKAGITTNEQEWVLNNFVIVSRLTPTKESADTPEALIAALYERLGQQAKPVSKSPNALLVSRLPSHFAVLASVELKKIDEALYQLSIVAKDRIGLLVDIAKTLGKFGVVVHRANINTLGVRAEDNFVIGVGVGADWQVALQKSLLAVVTKP